MSIEEIHQLNEDFLNAFPLDKLNNMSIEQYTNLNRSDSFCYWLEFKTRALGSVAGGSSYKFGIYKYDQKPQDKPNILSDDNYSWYKSLGETSDVAFKTIRDAIVNIANYGHEGNLEAIEQINILGPIIKWKIAFIYSEEKLIPYYSINRLKAISEKMGFADTKHATIAQMQHYLISKRDGKDIHEYGRLLDEIWKNNTNCPNEDDDEERVWMWAGDEKTFNKEKLTAGDMVSDTIKDYSVFSDYKTMRDAIQKARGNTDVSIPDAYWKFMKDVQVGDIVVVFKNEPIENKNNHTMLGWGVFTSDFINDVNSSSPLQREVEWKCILKETVISDIIRNKLFFHKTTGPQAKEIKKLLGIIKEDEMKPTISNDKKYQTYIDILKNNYNLVLTGAPGTGKTYMAREIAKEMNAEVEFVQFHPSYDYTDFVEGLRPEEKEGQITFKRTNGVFKEFCRKAITNINDSQKSIESLTKESSWKEKLEMFVDDAIENDRKFQTVNGSSFVIIDIKGQIIHTHNEQNEKYSQVSVNVDDILDILIHDAPLNNVKDVRDYFNRKFANQADSYTFIIAKAIRAMKEGNSTAVVRKIEKKPFVFIIDEINRGEASKIFGELFYAIDPGYRGKTDIMVQTQYQNLIPENDEFSKGFYVPDNVYILATMNDIDRSVESMDFAMRRRFIWEEVTPSETQNMLDDLGSELSSKAKEVMNRLNEEIAKTDGLGKAYMIGPAYFLKLKNNGGNFQKLWNMSIEPLLKEYLRGFRNTDEIITKYNKAYFGIKEYEEDNARDIIDEE